MLLAVAVRQKPDSAKAWLWLSAALKTPQGRAFCLREALAHDPDNGLAAKGLHSLAEAAPAPRLITRPSMGQRTVVDRLRLRWRSRPGSAEGSAPSSALSCIAKYVSLRALAIALTVVVGLFLAVVLINFGGFVDETSRSNIEWALMPMAIDMRDMDEAGKTAAIDQARWDMEEAAGLHEPFLSRCSRWLWQGLTLDLGESAQGLSNSTETLSVAELILQRLPNTLLLAGASNVLLFIVAIVVALVLSRKYGHWLDRLLVSLSPISSAPNWVYGILLTVVFAAQLRLLPFNGMYDKTPPATQSGYVWVVLRHMILPVTAIFLSVFFQAVYAWRSRIFGLCSCR